MYVVTGGAGFIGSNIVRALRGLGHEVAIVDNITEKKVRNVSSLGVAAYMSVEDFHYNLEYNLARGKVKGVFHQGACADTTRAQSDPEGVMKTNTKLSLELIQRCIQYDVPIVYASSAAVYGNGGQRYHFLEDPVNENPMNVYGFSKLLVDNAVRKLETDVNVVGLRYFNVYGPGEEHKGKMASVAYQILSAAKRGEKFEIFNRSLDLKRDFVHVNDVVNVNLYFMFGKNNKRTQGIYNVGTGVARSFRELIAICGVEVGEKEIPKELRQSYQMFTEADITSLRLAGYDMPFLSLERGIAISRQEWKF